jgi:hypothetical protein
MSEVKRVTVSDPRQKRFRGKDRKMRDMGVFTHTGYYVVGDITHEMTVILWHVGDEKPDFGHISGPFHTFRAAKSGTKRLIFEKLCAQKKAFLKFCAQRKRDVLVYKK